MKTHEKIELSDGNTYTAMCSEDGVWFVAFSDITGMYAEADTLEALKDIIHKKHESDLKSDREVYNDNDE